MTGEHVLAAERAYAAAAFATTGASPHRADGADDDAAAVARACAGAVASRYLAVGTPRSFAIIGDHPRDALSLTAHRVWFAPRDLRCTSATIAAAIDGARVVSLAEALAADIVCIHAPMTLAATQLRRGTHVNALAAVELDGELAQLAAISREHPDLPRLAAGLVDGRQLDEITIFLLER